MKKALIICNGTIQDYSAIRQILANEACDYCITVDGGIAHARRLDCVVDIAIGDFDSIHSDDADYLSEQQIPQKKYPSDKDMTDSEIAVDYCIENSCESAMIIAYNGTRLDHSFANILMFASKSLRMQITLADEHNRAYYVHDTVTLWAPSTGAVSIIPVSTSVRILQTSGLYYQITDTLLHRGETVGVSNYAVAPEQSITVTDGIALVTVSHD